jgi:hypothetical protein
MSTAFAGDPAAVWHGEFFLFAKPNSGEGEVQPIASPAIVIIGPIDPFGVCGDGCESIN